MKPRPRSVERRAAEELSIFFRKHGISPVFRIPILGRQGPDIYSEELMLGIDVKSRKAVPRLTVVPTSELISIGELIGCRLNEIELLGTYQQPIIRPPSLTVWHWYEHIRDNVDGIAALILHRPRTHVSNATFLIHKDDRELYIRRLLWESDQWC